MLNRQTVVLSLVLAVALIVSLPCLGAAPVKITHLSSASHSESWQDFLCEMKAPFEQENPGIEIEIITDAKPDEKFLVMAAGGIAPDVLDLVTQVTAPLIAQDMFMDLNKFLDPQTRNLIPPAMLNALTTPSGLLFMLPVEVYSIVTWYNLDMIRQAGLTPPAELKPEEWTWERMREYGRKLTVDSDGDGVAEIWGLDRMRSRPYIQTVQAGSNFFDRDIFPTKSLLLSEPVTAIEFIEKLIWQDRDAAGDRRRQYVFYHNRAAIDAVDGPGSRDARRACP